MKRQNKWELFWISVAVGTILIVGGLAVATAINSIDLTPHQIYTFEGIEYDCKFPAPDVMECHQVDDPDVGFGREQP